MPRRVGRKDRWSRFLQKRKNDLIFGLAVAGLWFFRALPQAFAFRLARWLGRISYYLLSRERKRALEHLRIAFPGEMSERRRRQIARRSFEHLALNAVELAQGRRIRSKLDALVTVVGQEHLDKALSLGQGVLWITGHLGNWELLAWYWAHKGYKLRVVAREVYDPRLNRLLMRFREEAGVPVILRDSPSAGREILKALKRKECLAMLIDQDTRVKGVMADFFGRKANTPAGPALLAVRQAVPVVAGFVHRISDCKHEIVISPPVEVIRTGDLEEDVRLNTERFNRILEGYIRAYPEQWVWMHRRWRRQKPYQAAGGRGARRFSVTI